MIRAVNAPAEVLERISPLKDVAGYARVADFLRKPSTQYHDGGGGNRVSVKQIDHAWGTRLLIARNKAVSPALGSEYLVETVNELPSETVLESAIFANEQELAAFWFVEATGVPVGFIIVLRNVVDGVPVPLDI